MQEPGQLGLSRTHDGVLFVDQADPRVWIAAGLVALLRGGGHIPGSRLAGDVLTIEAENRRVVYRLRQYLPGPDCWLAEWPD